MKPTFTGMLSSLEPMSAFLDCLGHLQPVYELCPEYNRHVWGNAHAVATHIERCEICLTNLRVHRENLKIAQKRQFN